MLKDDRFSNFKNFKLKNIEGDVSLFVFSFFFFFVKSERLAQ